MQKTGETTCAYCGMDLAGTYQAWLTMALDHVVPTGAGKALGIPDDWVQDAANRVLACTTCNTFDNRYTLPLDTAVPATLDAFCHLRDGVFLERSQRIAACHAKEREFYDQRPWEQK
jgi:hypothetical protein